MITDTSKAAAKFSRSTIFWPVFVLTGLNLLDYFDRYIVASVSTLIKQDLGLSDKAFGFLGSAFFLVYLVAAPIFGYLGDRWGRRRFMVLGAVLWSLATSLAFWVTTYPGLVIARGLVGIGGGFFRHPGPGIPGGFIAYGPAGPLPGDFLYHHPSGPRPWPTFLAGWWGAAWGWRWSFVVAGRPAGAAHGRAGLYPAALKCPGGLSGPGSQGRGLNLKAVLALWRIPTLSPGDHWVSFLTFRAGRYGFLDAPVPGSG